MYWLALGYRITDENTSRESETSKYLPIAMLNSKFQNILNTYHEFSRYLKKKKKTKISCRIKIFKTLFFFFATKDSLIKGTSNSNHFFSIRESTGG